MKILVDKNIVDFSSKKDKPIGGICFSNEVNPGDCYVPFCSAKCIIYNPRCFSFMNVYPEGNNVKK